MHQSGYASKVQRSLGLPLLPALRNCCSKLLLFAIFPLLLLSILCLSRLSIITTTRFGRLTILALSPLLYPKEFIAHSQQP